MNCLKLTLAAVAAIIVCNGCADENLREDGGLQRVTLNLDFCEKGAVTKSELPLDDASVKDLNIYIFNSAGGLVYHKFCSGTDVSLEDLYIYRGNRYTIFALANWGEEKLMLAMEELMELKYTPDNIGTLFDDEHGVIMSGKIEDTELYNGQHLQMELKRPVAKVSLKFDRWGLNKGVTLNITSITVKNVPRSVTLFKENSDAEVVDGATYSGDDLYRIFDLGLEFYLFENMQGDVAGATDNKSKAKSLTPLQRERGTYIEIECDILTDKHKGAIRYRFYLGSAMDNCNVERNSVQSVTVFFKGNVSENENSVSVDSGDLLDRVQFLYTTPTTMYLYYMVALEHQINVTIYPATAYDKRVKWTSSNKSVATVDANGLMKIVGRGECSIVARSLDNLNKTATCNVYIL